MWAAVLLPAVARADSVTYTPPGTSGSITASVSGSITATNLTAGPGITATSTVDSLSATGFDVATSPSAANTAGNYFTFTVAPLANYSLSFTSLNATASRDSVTPAPDKAAWFYSIDNFGNRLNGATTTVGTAATAVNRTLSDTGVTTAVEFRLAAFNNTGASATSFFAIGPTQGVTLNLTSALRAAGTVTWDGGRGDGNWSSYNASAGNQTNWNNNNTPMAGLSDDLVFAGTTQRNTTNDISGITANSIAFSATAGAFTLNGNSLTLNNGLTNSSASVHTINLNVTLGNAQTWNMAAGSLKMNGNVTNGSGLFTISGAFDSTFAGTIGGGAGGLQKDGAGLLVLNGSNTFTGNVTINAGTVNVKSIDSVPTNAQGLGQGTNPITLGSSSAATLVYTGNNSATLNRPITVGGAGGATIRTSSSLLSLGVSGGINGAGNPVTLDASGGNIVVPAVIAGTGTSVTKTGVNTVSFSGNNSFTSTLWIASGILSVNAIDPVATNPQPLGASASDILLGSATPATLTYTGASSTLNRNITLGAGGGTFRATGGNLIMAGGIAASGAPLTIDASGANITVNGVISGTGSSLTKTGSSNLLLRGTNTFDGPIAVTGGNLNISSIDPIATNPQQIGQGTSAIALGSATSLGMFSYTGNSATALNRDISIVGAGGGAIQSTKDRLTLAGNITTNGNPLTFAGADRIIVSGVVSGAGAITKDDGGTLTLSNAANSYTGATSVVAGTMLVNGAVTGAGGDVSVGTSAVLGGSGSIARNVNVNSTGVITAANNGTVGTLNTNSANLNSGGVYVFDISNATQPSGTGYDLLSINGTLTVGSSNVSPFIVRVVSSAPVAGFNAGAASSLVIAHASGGISNYSADKFTADVSGFTDDNPASGTFSIGTDANNNLTLNYTPTLVPEPSLLVVCPLGAMLRRRRRHS